MKITIERDGLEMSATLHEPIDVEDVVYAVAGLLVGYSYHPETVKDLFTYFSA